IRAQIELLQQPAREVGLDPGMHPGTLIQHRRNQLWIAERIVIPTPMSIACRVEVELHQAQRPLWGYGLRGSGMTRLAPHRLPDLRCPVSPARPGACVGGCIRTRARGAW